MTQTNYTHRFDNGLVLVAEEMNWLESAAFTLLVPVGCTREPDDRAGLVGFTCEMVLRGAGARDSRQFVEALDYLGVERGESVTDAHTSFSGATLAENLHDALAIYADVLRRPHLPADQLESARQVLLQELQAVEDDPHHKLMVELRKRHFPAPWGRPNHGDLAGIEATTIADIRQLHERFYRPNGALIGVAGRFDWQRLKDHVGQLLGDWPAREVPPIHEGQRGPRREHVDFDTNQTQIGIAYDSVPYRDPQYFQAWGGVGALSGGMSSRYFTEVREKRGLCYSVYATYVTQRDRGAVISYAGTSADRAQETLNVMLAELDRLKYGVYEQELERLKARIKSSLIMQQESSSARSGAIARDWYHLDRVRTMAEVGRLIDELSCDSINRYLAEHPPRDFTIVTLGPQPLEVQPGV
jgi:predicted Zn-dependent peptidase